MKKKTPKPDWTRVSEWIDAGGLHTDYLPLYPVRQTTKAFAVACQRFNRYGNPYPSQVWFPKSLCLALENDYYSENPGDIQYFVPLWLYQAKQEQEHCVI